MRTIAIILFALLFHIQGHTVVAQVTAFAAAFSFLTEPMSMQFYVVPNPPKEEEDEEVNDG
jgi:hypothetical protein